MGAPRGDRRSLDLGTRVLGFLLAVVLGASAAVAQQPSVPYVVWHEATLLQGVPGLPAPLRFTIGSGDRPETFRVDSSRWVGGRREVFGERSRLVVDSAGMLLAFAPRPRVRDDNALTRRLATRSLSRPLVGAFFPEVETASVHRSLPATLGSGQRFVEPIAWEKDSLGVDVRVTGTRWTTVLGDTLIDGRLHWQLRDSVALERSETWLEYSYVWEAYYELERRGPRTRVGRSIYDPERQLIRLRVDSVRWDVELQRVDPAGARTSVRQQVSAVDRWEVLSEADHQRRLDDHMRALLELLGEDTGMVRVPATRLQRRLSGGDPQALDSALVLWFAREPAPTMPFGDGDIVWWRGEVPWPRVAIDAALARGDTMAALRAADMLLQRQPLDTLALAFVLPLVANPAKALAWSLPIDFAINTIHTELLRLATCDPTVCGVLAAYRNRVDADPRVRDLGYAASFLLDPIGEYPNLVARAEVGTGAATSFVRSAQGYARQSTFPEIQRGPMPAGMEWREWWAWFNGELADVNGVALALNRRLTGRDLRAEVLDAYRSATGDSARFTYGVLIANQAPGTITADQVVALQEDGGRLSARLARLWRNMLLRSGDPAPDSVAGALLEALLAKLLDDANPAWEGFDADAIEPVEGAAVLITEGTPFPLTASARLPRVTLAEWQDRRPPLPDRAIRFGTPVVAGPFVRLSVTVEERFVAGSGYHYFARFVTIVLQRTSTGWRVLDASQAVT